MMTPLLGFRGQRSRKYFEKLKTQPVTNSPGIRDEEGCFLAERGHRPVLMPARGRRGALHRHWHESRIMAHSQHGPCGALKQWAEDGLPGKDDRGKEGAVRVSAALVESENFFERAVIGTKRDQIVVCKCIQCLETCSQ